MAMDLSSAIMEGLTATTIGMGIVFGVLALLSLVLSLLKVLSAEKPAKAKDSVADVEAEEALEDTDFEPIDDESGDELVAVVSAALAAFMGENAYTIKSIMPVRKTSTPWNIAARRENQRGIKY